MNATAVEIALALMIMTQSDVQADPKDAICLARNVYHEARGEKRIGQRAVAFVTMNRVEDEKWPDDVCSVVYQRRQFSWTSLGKAQNTPAEWAAYQRAMQVAVNVMAGSVPDPTRGATYFYDPAAASPAWARRMRETTRIGSHKFLKGL